MRAIRQQRFGDPDVLELADVADLEAGAGQVRIAVGAAGVHVLDTSIRAGETGGPFPLPDLPMTPGREVAGTVDQVGDGVEPSWLGRRVVAHLGMASGGYAEQAVVGADALIPLADATDLADAVSMVGTGRTALGVLEEAAIGADDVVLVTGAAGGLGSLLVQAAHANGATVAGVAGGADKVALVRSLGADVAVDHRDGDWIAALTTQLGERRVTVLLDGVGGDAGRAAFDIVGPGGRVVMFGYSAGAPMPLDAEDLFASGVAVTAAIGPRMMNRPGGIIELARSAVGRLEAGEWRAVVHPPFPLADAPAAHRALTDRRSTGKVVLVP